MTDKFDCLKLLCPRYKIKLMILFGSYDTNHFHEDSDIDLAIEVDDCQLIEKKRSQILNEISSIFSYREIDLILLNHADPLLKKQVVSSGKLIYERKPEYFNIFKVRAEKEHYDARKFYRLEEEYINNYIKGDRSHGKQGVSPPQID